jgi:hypothetical protein
MLRIHLAVCLFAIASIKAQDVSSSAALQKQTISTSVDTSILLALITFGSETHIPIGVVLETEKPHQLCEDNRHVTIRDRPISEFLDALLAQSNYAWSVNDGVIAIRPSHLADQVNRVLTMKFDRFGGMQTTMQGLGISLKAWIYSRLHPEANGFATDIISSPDAEQFAQFEVRDASVEQILNKIVSLGNKGIWILQMRRGVESNTDIDLHTYSYKDDVVALHTICSAISSNGK